MNVDLDVQGTAASHANGSQRAFWNEGLAPFARPHLGRGLRDIATAVVPYLALSAIMVLALNVSYLLVLALAVPAAGFLLRTFIIFHDCTHGSFLASKRANVWLGSFVGLFVYSPFTSWRHSHQVHHATSGDLDRRGTGDIMLWTVAEYESRGWAGRLGYRIFRNPLLMFGLGPIWALVVQPRFVLHGQRSRIQRSIIGTDLALVAVITGLCLLIGWQAFLLVQVPCVLLAGSVGVWLFYVQHQYEDAYWQSGSDWSYSDAALRGSSYLKLPKVLQFFSGNIGLHHVHHLSARVPNYHLQAAHDANPIFDDVPVLSLGDAMRAMSLKLYDERSQRLMTFGQARNRRVPAAGI
jgi:omega-6 fatty acid desaturase (delta-12 desaturase)